jgi:hypothetical protein
VKICRIRGICVPYQEFVFYAAPRRGCSSFTHHIFYQYCAPLGLLHQTLPNALIACEALKPFFRLLYQFRDSDQLKKIRENPSHPRNLCSISGICFLRCAPPGLFLVYTSYFLPILRPSGAKNISPYLELPTFRPAASCGARLRGCFVKHCETLCETL